MKSPVSTGLAVLTLGLTLGLFGISVAVIDDTFWRPLRVEHGDRILTLYNARPSAPQYQTLSYPDYVNLRDAVKDRVDVAAFFRVFQTFGGGEWPSRVQGELVSGNYFEVLGATPLAGRFIRPDDDRVPLGHPVVVLGYDLWRRHFGANPVVIGTSITLSRRAYTIVGVAPPEFRGPAYPSEFWIPLMMAKQVLGGTDVLAQSGIPLLQTIALPDAKVTHGEVQARVRGLETSANRDGWRLAVFPAAYLKFWPAYRTTIARFLLLFVALGGCVVVIACANVANLLLARNADRQHEMAIRQALGASPRHIVRRLVAESLTLTVLAGATGLFVAYAAAGLVERVTLPVPARIGLTPDIRLFTISIAVSFIAGLLFTAVFALRGLRHGSRHILAASSRTVSRSGAARALVIGQVAICCVCLTAAGLLLRSAMAVNQIDVGVDPSNTVMGLIGAGDSGYTPETGTAFFARLQRDLENQPQVEAVALEWTAMLGSVRGTGRITVRAGDVVSSRYNVVGSGYFNALRIPVIRGREFQADDQPNSEPVALVNETMAARIGDNVVGQTVQFGDERSRRRIVGVVPDLRYNGITEPPQTFIYLPLGQVFRPDVWVHVRTPAVDAEALLRNAVRRLDPNVSVSDVHTLSAQLDRARATPRLALRLSGALALIAVFLAVIGVYGVMSASIENRRQELAIRAAIGASPADLVAAVALGGLRLLGAGLVVGMSGSFLSSGLIAGWLYGVAARDVGVFAAVPVALIAVSVPAWWIPARRISRIDPATLLKSD
jgi:predicted permease